jgi:hypothetical protein
VSRPAKIQTAHVVSLHSQGFSYPEVAAQLGCTEKTVYRHMQLWNRLTPDQHITASLQMYEQVIITRINDLKRMRLDDPKLAKMRGKAIQRAKKQLKGASRLLEQWMKPRGRMWSKARINVLNQIEALSIKGDIMRQTRGDLLMWAAGDV